MKTGKVYLTGGGCGDAELLTLKALAVLRICDVVVYDSLVAEELLQQTKSDCEKIYVGKRYGSHAMKQPEINALLVRQAKAGKTVVRLKGGDPYVFGRGGEEFLAVKEAGIHCEEIPGISSAIAVPAAAGIPVTHRGLSTSLTIVTGTMAGEEGQPCFRPDFEVLARLQGTLVILMGMHHLEEIVEGLTAAGKNPDTPCAVIMEGTTGRQKCLRTVLSRLSTDAKEQGFTSPAVIVIGMVAGMELLSEDDDKAEYERTFHQPLSGTTVGVTGTSRFVEKLSQTLAEKGADVWDMGFMAVRPNEDPLPELEDCDWLVFTSPNGVRVFLDKMKQERKDLRILHGKKIAVIGQGTASVLEEIGIYADYMPEVYDTLHLAQGLAEKISDDRQGDCKDKISAVFLRARQGSEVLPHIFAGKAIPFLDYPLYDLEVEEEKRAVAVRREPDYLVFGSAMGVRAYFEGREQAGLKDTKSRCVCIGERCGEALKKYADEKFLTAREAGVEEIAECLCKDIK